MPKIHIPRKRFGQNFLIDPQVTTKIVDTLHPNANDNLVEIGAGLGALTKKVLTQISHLTVIEIDKDLTKRLQETYPATKVTIYQENALTFPFDSLYKEKHKKLRLFGNLPYNISTPLLFYLLTFSPLIQDMLFMLQKEVVMRMGATPNSKTYGRLSIMIQYACEVRPLFDVLPYSFSPPPKVTSSLVQLIPYNNNRPFPLAKDISLLSSLVTHAFSHRRKTLKNALSEIVSSEAIYDAVKIDPTRRPETLGIEEFISLSNVLSNQT